MKPSIVLIILLEFNFLSLSAQHCLSEGIVFTRQSQIDSFPLQYPGCTQIDGDFEIAGEQSDITSLISLAQIESIKGNVKIHDLEYVMNLLGLHQIKSIGGDLRIIHNNGLSNCAGLNHLEHVKELLLLQANDNLQSLIGLDSLQYSRSLSITENDRLQDLSGLEKFDSVNYIINISSNPGLKSLKGLEGLKILFGDIHIYNNDSLLNLSGLNNLTTLFGSLWIISNPRLISLFGLGSLSEIYGDFEVKENSLTSFSGPDLLEKIHGSFEVKDNMLLQNFLGLSNLNSVGVILIEDNPFLISLAGLEGLRNISNSIGILSNISLVDLSALISATNLKKQINIKSNTTLSSLYGLDHLCNSFIDKVDISGNDHLSDCGVASICIHLTHGGIYFIAYNSPGCNTREEIIDDCLTATQNPGVDEKIFIYPNPTYDRIEVSTSNTYPKSYSFIDPSGKRLKTWPANSTSLDVSEFSPGVYILNIEFPNQQVNRRIIKL